MINIFKSSAVKNIMPLASLAAIMGGGLIREGGLFHFYSACRRRGGVLNSPRFCFFFFFYFFSVSEVGAALMGDTAGTNRVSRPQHGV